MKRIELARRLLVVLSLLSSFALAGCTTGENNWTRAASPGSERRQRVVQTVAADQCKKLVLRTGPGEVTLIGTSEPVVGIEVEKRAAGSDSAAVDQYLEGIRLEVKAVGESIQVTTRLPEQAPAGVKLIGVRYLIEVPHQVRGVLDVEADQATVRLTDLAAEATVKVRQADLEVRGFTGSLKATVEQGQTLIQGLDGQLEVKSDGPVELRDARLRPRGRVETVNSRIWASLLELGVGQYEFLTTNAPVQLALPYGVAARLRVATTNGKVYDELPLTWVDRNETDADGVYHFEGWLNAGGAQVGIVTTNADVTLTYR
ncbi:MAG: hypothetical protein ACM3XZ_11965 [Betaproteobacteria bacterium]